MKLASFRRLFKTDYPDEFQAVIEKLSTSLNYGIEALYDALNNKLTFQDNFSATITSVNARVDINGTPVSPITFALSTSNQAINGVLVLSTVNKDLPLDYPPAAVGVSFTTSTTSVTINNIRGLKANTNYVLKLLAV